MSGDMSERPAFLHITPERIDVIYQELMKAYSSSPNDATKWSVRRQALEALEREQERVTRIHVASYAVARDAVAARIAAMEQEEQG